LTQVLPARIDSLTSLGAFVDEVGALAGFSHHDCLRLTLVLEELFTNTVEHGFGGDCDELVEIACEIEPGRVAVTYEDAAPRFDPRALVPGVDESLPEVDRPPGRLGLLLVARLAAEVDYSRMEGRNRISLAVVAT